ncbi:MAG: ABC transporter substrate-binding protein [Microbacteriaceae bacterium]
MSTRRSGKKIVAMATAVMFAATLAACSSPEPEETGPIELRMTWWGGDARHEVTNEALDLFESQNEGITVVRDFGGFDGYLDKITTQYAGKNSPDVIQLYNEVLVEFAQRGQVYDLNMAVESGDLSLDGWPDDLIATNTIDGELSALPFGLSTHGFIFDEAKSAELGVELPSDSFDWDDLATYGADIRSASGGSVAGVTDLSHSYQVFEVFAKQNGEEFLTADGIGFDESTLIDYWNYWADMRASGAATAPDVSSEYLGTPYDAVIAGVATSTFLFVNQYEGVQASTPNALALTRMPAESSDPGQYLRTAMNLIVSSQSEHPEAAAKLVNFLVNSEEANAILGIDRGVPANSNVVAAATSNVNDIVAKAMAIIESVRANGSAAPVPAPVGSGTVNTIFSEYAQQVQFDRMTVEEAAAEFLAQAASELG